MRRYVEALETIAPRLYYLPGNHDAEITFAPDAPKLGKTAINLHLKSAKIEPGLVIVGMGGSKPTLLRANGSTEWQEIYNPYPWGSEEQYKAAL